MVTNPHNLPLPPPPPRQVQSLKTILKEKDKQLEQLEREYHQGRTAWEKEEKLVVSAWHEMVSKSSLRGGGLISALF